MLLLGALFGFFFLQVWNWGTERDVWQMNGVLYSTCRVWSCSMDWLPLGYLFISQCTVAYKVSSWYGGIWIYCAHIEVNIIYRLVLVRKMLHYLIESKTVTFQELYTHLFYKEKIAACWTAIREQPVCCRFTSLLSCQ